MSSALSRMVQGGATLAVMMSLSACADDSELARFIGPTPGSMNVLVAHDGGEKTMEYVFKGVSAAAGGGVVIEEWIQVSDGQSSRKVRYELVVRDGVLVKRGQDGSEVIVMRAPLRAGAPEWSTFAAAVSPDIPSSCSVAARGKDRIVGQMRETVSIRCHTKLPGGRTFRRTMTYADDLGLVRDVGATLGVNGSPEGQAEWVLERIEAIS